MTSPSIAPPKGATFVAPFFNSCDTILIMKLVILRGLPGCGKSTIAEELSNKLNSQVIYGDSFKREFMIANSDFKNEEVYLYSYDKITEEIERYFDQKEKLVVVDELFDNKEFVGRVKSFCKESNIEIFWFYIQRDFEKLLETEHQRERKIKNTIEDFKSLQNSLDKIKNEEEVFVDNNNDIKDSVEFILKNLENKL